MYPLADDDDIYITICSLFKRNKELVSMTRRKLKTKCFQVYSLTEEYLIYWCSISQLFRTTCCNQETSIYFFENQLANLRLQFLARTTIHIRSNFCFIKKVEPIS